ncbi:MAG: alpha-L-rhamnosidase N-terminal domain-containing protein [Chitinophagaceae bacterium]|nr:alpha-L-rhamnosidase N-terminal domain-containing protein [Chitinophagaceae bacterium]
MPRLILQQLCLLENDWANATWIGFEELQDSLKLVPGVHVPPVGSLGNKAMSRSVVPQFRKEFALHKKITRATLFITGLGHYEATINGKKIGEAFLAPGWTYYDKTVLYNTYDITKQLASGGNTIGVIVGNGFYNINMERYYKLVIAFGLPKMICRLRIEYADGAEQNIVSGQDWKVTASPITYSSIYAGEEYDARMSKRLEAIWFQRY